MWVTIRQLTFNPFLATYMGFLYKNEGFSFLFTEKSYWELIWGPGTEVGQELMKNRKIFGNFEKFWGKRSFWVLELLFIGDMCFLRGKGGILWQREKIFSRILVLRRGWLGRFQIRHQNWLGGCIWQGLLDSSGFGHRSRVIGVLAVCCLLESLPLVGWQQICSGWKKILFVILE